MIKVSIITPTYDREKFHPQIYACFKSQDYLNLEWLILDDSPAPSLFFSNLEDKNIFYTHTSKKLRNGDKRNRLVEEAKGDLIVHFDDDDFYNFNYISSMVNEIQRQDLDLLNLRGWFLLDIRHHFFGYWDLNIKEGLHFVCERENLSAVIFPTENKGFENNHLGYGFGYCYKKTIWKKTPFLDINWNQDGEFALSAQKNQFKLGGLQDHRGICLHICHVSNSSRCFPQYHLPKFLLPQLFPKFDPALIF